jgi:hypothetical protein
MVQNNDRRLHRKEVLQRVIYVEHLQGHIAIWIALVLCVHQTCNRNVL